MIKVISVILLAVALRLPMLTGSFWLDEAAQALESTRPLQEQLDITHDFQPPLYHLWLHAFTYFGQSEWWFRMSSLIPGLITIYFTYLLGRLLSNSKTGLIAALLLSTSQFHIFYSQELRPYSFAAMWGVISSYYFVKTIKNHKVSRLRHIISSIAGLYSVYTFPFLLISQVATATILARKHAKTIIKNILIASIFFLPWIQKFSQQLRAGLTLNNQTPGWGSAVSFPVIKSIPLTITKLIVGRIEVDYSPLIMIITTLILATWIIAAYQLKNYKKLRHIITIISLVFASSLLVHIFIPIIEPKRLLFLLPLLCFIPASLAKKSKPLSLLPTIIISFNLLVNAIYLQTKDFQREPWRQAVAEIESNSSSDSVVVFAFETPLAPWVYYQTKNLDTVVTGHTISSDPQEVVYTKLKPLLVADNIFVFEYLMDITDPKRATEKWIQSNGFYETGFYQYPSIGKVKIFSRQNQFAVEPNLNLNLSN